MNLDDLVDLAGVVIDEIEEAICGGHEDIVTFLRASLLAISLAMLDDGLVEVLAPGCVIQND